MMHFRIAAVVISSAFAAAMLCLLISSVYAQQRSDNQPTLNASPATQHQKLRDCALQWQTMKRNGEAKGKIWRDFSAVCLGPSENETSKQQEQKP